MNKNRPSKKFERTLSQRNPVYYYSWEHVTAFSLADLFLTKYNLVEVIAKFTRLVFGTFESESLGVAHADDVLTLFNLAPLDDYFNLVPRTEDDTQFQKRVVDLWANFATFGTLVKNSVSCEFILMHCLTFGYQFLLTRKEL